MEHAFHNGCSPVVGISQMIYQYTRVIIFIVIPFEYSQTPVSSREGAWPLLDFSLLRIIDYECRKLQLQQRVTWTTLCTVTTGTFTSTLTTLIQTTLTTLNKRGKTPIETTNR